MTQCIRQNPRSQQVVLPLQFRISMARLTPEINRLISTGLTM